MSGRLLLSERVSIVRALWPELAERPDWTLTFQCLDVEAVIGGGHLTVPGERHLEPEILRLAAPYLAGGAS